MAIYSGICKRISDVAVSASSLVMLSPLLAVIALLIKAGSNGPVIYSQERIGLHGRPFRIYKFRTMVEDAEKEGPTLAKDNDPRVTRFGRFLRQHHLDELPQFWNILRGDMSLVGPRPERRYFIELISKTCPEYPALLTVRPGLTSLGMVRHGYASDVSELVERSRSEMDYLEDRTALMDLRILLESVKAVVRGGGK